jgi:hypothetical protein
MNKDYFFIKQMKLDVISFSTTEPANYTGSYTAEYRIIIAGILKKGVNN